MTPENFPRASQPTNGEMFGEIDATLDDLNREYFTLLDQEAH